MTAVELTFTSELVLYTLDASEPEAPCEPKESKSFVETFSIGARQLLK